MKPIRLPLAAALTDRELAYGGTYSTDTMLVNCYVETSEGKQYVVKRPGYSTQYTYNGGLATNGQGTVYYQGGIYAVGSNVLYRLSGAQNGSADGTAWTSSTAGPWNGRANFGCVVFKGSVFIMGGENTGGVAYLNDVWASTDLVTWTQVASAAPWAKRRNMNLVVLGDTLFLIGGDGTSQYNDVWSTTDGSNWTQVVSTASWEARGGAVAVAFNQGIFFMAGLTTSGSYSQQVWFSPDGTTWTQQVTTAAWAGRTFPSLLVYGGKMWIAGGTGATGLPLADVWSSPDGINWTNTGNLPAIRSQMGSTVYLNKMWFVAGLGPAAANTTTVWSTTDGVTFTVVAASYGGNAVTGARLITYQTPTSVSTYNAASMWLIGGLDTVSYRSAIYYATLNVALPSSWSIGTAGTTTTQFKFTTQNFGRYLVLKNTSDAWVLYAGTLQKITSANYPTATVPGIVNLDDTLYVMDARGVIYGSNLSDPFNWSALNDITADYDSDTAVAIAKYQNFVVAFKSFTTQFFYDAGRYPGSPLLPVVNANCRVGCVNAGTIAAMNNTLVFMARSNTFGNYIAMLDGYNPVRISSPDVERILNSWIPDALAYAFTMRENGHDFYFLTLKGANVTLVYDMGEKRWHTRTSGSNYFAGVNYVTDGSSDYVQDLLLGKVYIFSPIVYQDAGATITVSGVGNKVDGGNNNRKFCTSITVIGDRRATAPNNLTLSWSDDDAQTFSSGVVVDLTISRPRINRCGSFRRRQHKFVHTSNNPMRLEALELEVMGSE